MKPFSIEYDHQLYQIELNDNRTFSVFKGEKNLGIIYPEAGTFSLEWQSENIKNKQLVCEIGELIAAHQLGNVPL